MSITKKEIKRIEAAARGYFKKIGGCHDWSHVERVTKLALKIGRIEGADLRIVEVAALLHDIGRREEDLSCGLVCHAEISAQKSRKLLAKYHLTKKEADNVHHAILCHRFRNNHEPLTLEAKVLFDADKLDSIGAIGIGRDFQFAGEVGARLYNIDRLNVLKTKVYSEEDTAWREYVVKLSKIKDRILTKTGKRLAAERHQFMVNFFKQFWREVDGLK